LLIIGSVIIAVIVAFLFLRYTHKIYASSGSILIEKSENENKMSDMSVANLSMGMQQQTEIANEMFLLKSRGIMEKVVDSLNLNVKFIAEGKIKKTEVYVGHLPFEILGGKFDSTLYGTQIDLEYVNSEKFYWHEKGKKYIAAFDHPFRTESGVYHIRNKINLNSDKKSKFSEGIFEIKIVSPRLAVNQYMNVLSVSNVKNSNVIELQVTDRVPEKARDIVNKLIEVYTIEDVNSKNFANKKTINFIDERLRHLVVELGETERESAAYKTQTALYDASASNLYLQKAADITAQRLDVDNKIDVLNSLESFLNSSSKDIAAPSAGVIGDPSLIGMIDKYKELQMERRIKLNTVEEKSEQIKQIDGQISSIRSSISNNIRSLRRQLEITRNSLSQNTNNLENMVKAAPNVERALVSISRNADIKSSIYKYLLQKKEETQILEAAAAPDSKIIDNALTNSSPVSPKPTLIYLGAIFAGLLIPMSFVVLREYLNNKITTIGDIKTLVDVPVIGEVIHHKSDELLVVKDGNRDAYSEIFRLIRTNLRFLQRDEKNKTILITSSMSGEGKTSFTVNLGATLALANKKVIMLEFDIRRPKMLSGININVPKGITNYLIDDTINLKDIVHPVVGYRDLYVIGAGPVPPNPSELLMSDKLASMMELLKKEFDYILIDSSPVGQVSDAFSFNKYIDNTIYIVRYNYTYKEQLHIVKDIVSNKKLENLVLVMNDADIINNKSYGYGYGYGYGYSSDIEK
jgi:tyrosine-protein kinase Etk/Wzc